MTKKKNEYTDSIAEIEQILAQIENDELNMDELSEKIKRVNLLIKGCKKKLFETEQEVEEIIKSMDNNQPSKR
jgi:exodeoxyribonuclease VII small subunit